MRTSLARAGLLAVALATLCCVAPAAAHVQVTPTVAATEDAVKFTVLVPGESSSAETTKVALKVPPGALPYSYGEAPGWRRHLVLAKDQSVEQIVWTGRLAADGFAEFSFLAATPARPTVLSWKALQFYSDATVVRWIGSPSAEYPAARTVVRAGATVQNAGGEGALGADSQPPAASAASDSGDAGGWVAVGLAALALLVALLALVRSSAKRKESR